MSGNMRCVICNEGESSDHLVHDPGLDKILPIKEYAVKRASLGELNLKPLADLMESLSLAELNLVRYHAHVERNKSTNSY